MSTELAITSPPAGIALPEPGPVDVVAAFLSGRNPNTLKAYDRDLKYFAKAIGQRDGKSAVEFLLSQPHGRANAIALAYRSHMIEKGLKSATVSRRLAALRAVVKLARSLGRVVWALDIEGPKVVPYRDTKGPGDGGWYLLLAYASVQAQTGTPKGIRDLALLRACHDLAMRRGELASLELASVDLEGGTIAIVGKGQTDPQSYTLPDPTRIALASWIAVRGSWPGPLFTRLDRARGPEGSGLTADGIYYLVVNMGKRAGVKKRVWPHALRHLAVTQCLDRTNGNLRVAQKFSRHADPRTLLRYDDSRTDAFGTAAKLVAGD